MRPQVTIVVAIDATTVDRLGHFAAERFQRLRAACLLADFGYRV